MKECLRDMLYDKDGDEVDAYNLDAKNWPNAKDEEGEDAGSLDMENYEFMELTDTRLVMECGGDWQLPMRVVIELVDGELTVTSATEVEQYKEGMDEEEFKKILLAE